MLMIHRNIENIISVTVVPLTNVPMTGPNGTLRRPVLRHALTATAMPHAARYPESEVNFSCLVRLADVTFPQIDLTMDGPKSDFSP